jgi:hypothetical protein
VFSITPNKGYAVYDVIVNGVSIGAVSSYTITNISEDIIIVASFAAVYSFNEGWNLIALAMEPKNAYTSGSLLEAINKEGKVRLIQRWDGTWKTYNSGAPFGAFDIEMGKGYFLFAEKNSTWLNNGEKWKGSAYTFNRGYNLFGFPHADDLHASTLAESINKSDGNVTSIRRWDGSGLESYTVGTPFGDFQIINKEGYFLYSTKQSSYEIEE